MKQIIGGILYDTALCAEIISFEEGEGVWQQYFKTPAGEFLFCTTRHEGFLRKKSFLKVVSLADILQALENRPATQQVYEAYTKLYFAKVSPRPWRSVWHM